MLEFDFPLVFLFHGAAFCGDLVAAHRAHVIHGAVDVTISIHAARDICPQLVFKKLRHLAFVALFRRGTCGSVNARMLGDVIHGFLAF